MINEIKEIYGYNKGLAVCLSFTGIAYALAFICAVLELFIN